MYNDERDRYTDRWSLDFLYNIYAKSHLQENKKDDNIDALFIVSPQWRIGAEMIVRCGIIAMDFGIVVGSARGQNALIDKAKPYNIYHDIVTDKAAFGL